MGVFPSISLIVSSPAMSCALAVMNPNSVPSAAGNEFNAASQRLAIFLQHTMLLSNDLDKSRQDFYTHLSRNWFSYQSAARQKPELECIAFADGLGYLARLHSILYEFKAFLDIFTRMTSKLAPQKPGPHGFNKGKVAGVDLAGGRLINWLEGHSAAEMPNRDRLVRLVREASEGWITNVVGLRDAMSHYREIPGFQHMSISLSNGPERLAMDHIALPALPSGEGLQAFSTLLRDRLCNLVSETLPLLPSVKAQMNEPWKSAKRYLEG